METKSQKTERVQSRHYKRFMPHVQRESHLDCGK